MDKGRLHGSVVKNLTFHSVHEFRVVASSCIQQRVCLSLSLHSSSLSQKKNKKHKNPIHQMCPKTHMQLTRHTTPSFPHSYTVYTPQIKHSTHRILKYPMYIYSCATCLHRNILMSILTPPDITYLLCLMFEIFFPRSPSNTPRCFPCWTLPGM